jgi:hypothetical protein
MIFGPLVMAYDSAEILRVPVNLVQAVFQRIFILATIAALLGGAAYPAAGAVVYDEAVSGDLSNLPAPAAINLELGANSIKGHQFFDNHVPGPCCFDTDSFAFAVPAGTHLAAVTFESIATGSTSFSETDFVLHRGNGQFAAILDRARIELTATPSTVALFSGQMPLRAGTYSMINDGGGVTFAGIWSADYTFDLLVASGPVPEPSLYLFLVLGLAVLAKVGAAHGARHTARIAR